MGLCRHVVQWPLVLQEASVSESGRGQRALALRQQDLADEHVHQRLILDAVDVVGSARSSGRFGCGLEGEGRIGQIGVNQSSHSDRKMVTSPSRYSNPMSVPSRMDARSSAIASAVSSTAASVACRGHRGCTRSRCAGSAPDTGRRHCR